MINNSGYLDNSPYRYNPYNIIPSDIITMDNVSQPLIAVNNRKAYYLPANSGKYRFKGKNTLELPVYQSGGNSQLEQEKSLLRQKGFFIGEQTAPNVPDLSVNNNVLKNAILPKPLQDLIKTTTTNNSKPYNNGNNIKDISLSFLNTIAPIQQTLLGLSRRKDFNDQLKETQSQLSDPNYNPTAQYVENDYGTKINPLYEEGGELDYLDFLYEEDNDDDNKKVNDKISENEEVIESDDINERLDKLNQMAIDVANDDYRIQHQQSEYNDTEEPFDYIRKIRNDSQRYFGKIESNRKYGKDTLNTALSFRDYAMQQGLSKEEASGLIGNAYAESDFRPTLLGTADNKGSVGLFQPHSERLTALKKYAASQGKDWRDPY